MMIELTQLHVLVLCASAWAVSWHGMQFTMSAITRTCERERTGEAALVQWCEVGMCSTSARSCCVACAEKHRVSNENLLIDALVVCVDLPRLD